MKKRYKLNLKLLSPVHIGTGEVYEPMNFVIKHDEISGKDYMLVFDEFEFYANLSETDKSEFLKLAEKTGVEAILGLRKFVMNRIEIISKISHKEIVISDEAIKDYDEKIDKIVQIEPNSDVLSKLAINKTYTSPNSKKSLILGSSLKGAISTAFQEAFFKKELDKITNFSDDKFNEMKQKIISSNYKKNQRRYDEACDKFLELYEKLNSEIYEEDFLAFENTQKALAKPNNFNLFKQLKISDSSEFDNLTLVDYAKNIKRKSGEYSIKVLTEIIWQDNQSVELESFVDIFDDKLTMQNLANACNKHYLPIFESIFTDENLSQKLDKRFKKIDLKANQFILRVGKYSGGRAVTIDGLRNIKITHGKDINPTFESEEITLWLINSLPFGWVLCEYNEI